MTTMQDLQPANFVSRRRRASFDTRCNRASLAHIEPWHWESTGPSSGPEMPEKVPPNSFLPGPEFPKKSQKGLPAPSGPDSQKSVEQGPKGPEKESKRSQNQCSGTFSTLLDTPARKAWEDFLETFWGLRAQRASGLLYFPTPPAPIPTATCGAPMEILGDNLGRHGGD